MLSGYIFCPRGNNENDKRVTHLVRALEDDALFNQLLASVDYETDRNIQETIAREFHDRTILCIAREFVTLSCFISCITPLSDRLRTIISYDKICVMDAGQVAEFDTPSNLFSRTDSIFRSMCDQSSISWEDIRLASKVKE